MEALRLGRTSVSIVGAGAAGSALARALSERGFGIAAVISRSEESAKRLASAVGGGTFAGRLSALPSSPAVLVLAVPDDEIPAVVGDLTKLPIEWTGFTVLHLSGALSSAVLEPLRSSGAEVASFHPMLSLHSDSPPGVFAGAWISVEGTRAAADAGCYLAEQIGARPVRVDPETKSVIHLVAAVASNYLVTLMSMAADILSGAGIDEGAFDALLRPLVTGTLENIDFTDPSQALTGPIARGDIDTVRRHLRLLQSRSPRYVPAVASLMAETVRIAARSASVSDEDAAAILDLLMEAVDGAAG